MIGKSAYEKKPGGRKLGAIVGQRTTPNAEGVPVEQWEIRSGRGIKFFMPKAEVCTDPAHPMAFAPEPEPAVPAPPPAPAARPAEPAVAEPVTAPRPVAPPPVVAPQGRIEEEVARFDPRLAAVPRRGVLPVAVTMLGVALCIASGVFLALGYARRLSESYEAIVGAIPGLIGLLIVLIGTNLVAEQSKRRALLRRKPVEEAHKRSLEGSR
ncbi:MAG: hypothetical protein JW889_15940 [Verrucomicrobia bacterium]|nr:hypothetical protein [Verrucomicrobiota bacterium]